MTTDLETARLDVDSARHSLSAAIAEMQRRARIVRRGHSTKTEKMAMQAAEIAATKAAANYDVARLRLARAERAALAESRMAEDARQTRLTIQQQAEREV